ncbi:MAG: hypothetical protein ACTSRU_00485 [Candidatus Hodarchaeales archaeon]
MEDREILSEVICLAVLWDEAQGPTIITEVPPQALNDPINICLQIYMASVTIFGQMQTLSRVEITLPILTVSPDHVVRVAYDSWPDTEVRGNERPCYIAFIMENTTAKKLDEFLGKKIWNYIDRFKIDKEDFDLQPIWTEITDYLKGDIELVDDFIAKIRGELEGYTYSEAIEDLKNASDLWETARDRNALRLAIKSAMKFEDYDHSSSGKAYYLAAAIQMGSGHNQEAYEYFLKSVDNFKKSDDKNATVEALFNAAISAFRLENYSKTRDHLLDSVEMTDDIQKKGRMYLYIALSQDHLREFEQSDGFFQKAIENAVEVNDMKFAARIASTFAFRLNERSVSESDPDTKKILIERSAKQRVEAAKFFEKIPNYSEAGSSYTLASKAYLLVNDETSAVKALDDAATMFAKDSDYQSAGKALLDTAGFLTPGTGLITYLNRAEEMFKKIEKEDLKKALLTALYRRLAKSYETARDYRNAMQTYLKNHDLASGSGNNIEVVSASLSLASMAFKLEDYSTAGKYFLDASDRLGALGDDKRVQKEKCLKNASISYRRASQSYKQAGNVALFEGNEIKALDCFEKSIELLAQAMMHQGAENTELSDMIKQELSFLTLKESLFEQEQPRLKKLIQKTNELL